MSASMEAISSAPPIRGFADGNQLWTRWWRGRARLERYGECHEYSGVHRTSGRIYKISYGQPKRNEIGDVSKLSASELVKLHTHANEWFSRKARLELTGGQKPATTWAARKRSYARY